MGKKLLILILGCFLGGSVWGANFKDTLKLYQSNYTYNGTHDTLVLSSKVLITGNSDTFSGNIYLNVMVNGDTIQNSGSATSYFTYSHSGENGYLPITTIVLSISLPVNLKDFKNPGNNIVVVWPTGGSNLTNTKVIQGVNDTFNVNLAGIAPSLNYDNYVKFYPNPFTDWIRIQKLNPDLKIAQIKISDVSGRALLVKNEDVDYLSLPNLPKGMYFLDIKYTDGNTSRFKLTGL